MPIPPMESKSTNIFRLIQRESAPIGDVLMKHFSAHVAVQEATVAFQNAVLRIRKKMDYATIPWATFTDPEVAGIGITEAQAKADEIPCRVFRLGFDEVDRAVIDGCTDGFAKVVTSPDRQDPGRDGGRRRCGHDHPRDSPSRWPRDLPLRDLAAAVPIYPSYGSVVRSACCAGQRRQAGKGIHPDGTQALLWVHPAGDRR